MPRNVALVAEAPRAHGASVGLLAGVRPLVRRNFALVGEHPWAHGASVGLLAGVGPLVPGNGALTGEAPGAHGASKRPHPGVRPLVGATLRSYTVAGHLLVSYGVGLHCVQPEPYWRIR